MTREWNWWFDMNVDLVNSSSYLVINRTAMMYVKNALVAHGGWEVVGSSTGSLGTWEYEGVTGGGSYGGQSTGPYDVWALDSDINYAVDGNKPGFCVLKGPRWGGATPYLIIGYEGTQPYEVYLGGCGEKPSLIGGNADYLPVSPGENTEFCEWRRIRWFEYYGEMRTHLSICTDNGSFILLTDRIGSAGFNGIMGLMRFDPRKSAPTFALASGEDWSNLGENLYDHYWKCWSPTPQTWNSNLDPSIADERTAQWANPVRYNSVDIMNTDLNTVNCFGDVEGFPFYLVVTYEYNNYEQKCGTFGRIPDMFVAPWGLTNGDTVGAGGSVEYFVCGYWLLPGDEAPVVG